MPRGRPKGSKNTPKDGSLISSIIEVGREYAVREVAANGIIWVSPGIPPFLTKEEAEAKAKAILSSGWAPIAEVVNQKERLANRGGSVTIAEKMESEDAENVECVD